ncbi:MAG TPA: endonuclease/exonuclease/phosphatase family protein [Dongiaceae bacterium]|nr:endonuclease/exonuclease/phosphatase family protein [Dongiaceae bacterium]
MNSVLTLLLHLLVAFLAVATALAILFPRRPVLGVPQHWGLQLWQLSLLAAIAGLLLSDWMAVAMSAAVGGYWSWRLWPRRAPGDAIEEATPLLRIVSANLLYENLDFDRTLRGLVALDADVLVLSEVTPEMRQHLRRLATSHPHALDTCAPENVYGILILSRFPLTLRSTGVGEDPTPRHIAAELSIGIDTISLIAIHPTNPLRFSRAHRIPAEFDAVADLCRTAPSDLVLIGDCNAAGWSSYLRALERAAGLANDGRMRPSWPIWLPPLVRLPLDHVWVRGRVALLKAGLGPRFGSDHLPLVAEIGFRDQMSEIRGQMRDRQP